jgi:peptide/nickel transport system permease protein
MTMRRLAKNKLALAGGIVFLALCLVALFADIIAPYDYYEIDAFNKFARPNAEHLFGTDQYGRDVFSRIIYGARWSLSMGLLATLLSTAAGVVIGAVAGYFGGKIDTVIMRFIDIVQSIPPILLVVSVATVLGDTFLNMIIAMAVGGIWGTARMLRGQILTVRTQQYADAAIVTNNPRLRIILKHVLPNAIQPTIIHACMHVGTMLQVAAGLSFIGLGIQPPLPEWGAMLNDARVAMRYYPFLVFAPGLMIILTVLSISLIGDGVRDAMDPRMTE